MIKHYYRIEIVCVLCRYASYVLSGRTHTHTHTNPVLLGVRKCARRASGWNKTNTFTKHPPERIEAQVFDRVDASIRYRQCVRFQVIRKSQNHCQCAISMIFFSLCFCFCSVFTFALVLKDYLYQLPCQRNVRLSCWKFWYRIQWQRIVTVMAYRWRLNIDIYSLSISGIEW